GRLCPVCQSCGRRGRSVQTDEAHVSVLDLGRGWSASPYPEGYQHADGSSGTRYVCPACNASRRMAGALRSLLTAHGVTVQLAADALEIPEDEAAAVLSDLAHAEIAHLYALAGYCGTQ